ncbi:HD domain-containing protein [Natronorubrum sp. DTA7]|uniref:HD domain-containing protein n=1 Tax=Natronorubrum sp. DTA7 TaxID=3447016 RepID=UPI003F8570A5
MNPLERAIEIALEAHTGQTDKSGNTYILHPLRVMLEQDTEEAMIAAVLHDVVEDSDWEIEDLRQDEKTRFPTESLEAVEKLTKTSEDTYDEFVEQAAEHPISREVKRADIEDNMDLTRLESIDDDTLDRVKKYHRSWHRLN